MSHNDLDHRLVYMANQIGKFFASMPSHKAAVGIENHLRKFWEPRMRERIIAYLDKGGDGLDEYPRQAVMNLRSHAGMQDAESSVSGAGNVQGNPALSGAKLATGEDRGKRSTEAEPMIPDSVARP
jgi:formate dehydrogenase subunit delta